MKSRAFTWITAMTLFTALAGPARLAAQKESAAENEKTDVRYTITDLGPVGGTPGQPYSIANNGLVSVAAANPDGTMHAALWYKGSITDIGTPGLGGPNSAAFGVNERGQAVGQAETSIANGEDFCGFNFYGFPSVSACLPFLWHNGVMRKLSTLGGANGFANSINNRGEVAGLAETTITDPAPGCPVFQFRPVMWKNGVIQELQTYPGDSDGVAAFINDKGQAVGRRALAHPSTRIVGSISWKITHCSGKRARSPTSATSAGLAESRETTPVQLTTEVKWSVIRS